MRVNLGIHQTYELLVPINGKSWTERWVISHSSTNLFGSQVHIFQVKDAFSVQDLLQNDREAVDVTLCTEIESDEAPKETQPTWLNKNSFESCFERLRGK